MGFWDWLWSKAVAHEVPRSLAVARPERALPPFSPAPSNGLRSSSVVGEAHPHTSSAPSSLASLPAPPPAPRPAFDIETAIDLMRALPLDDDPELVLRVVRKTLRSVGVSVEEVVVSAKAREEMLVDEITKDRETIEKLEGEIAERRKNIDRVMAVLEETQGVRTNLEDAMRSESKVGPLPIPPDELARLRAAAPPPKTASIPVPRAAPSPPGKRSSPPRPPPPAPPRRPLSPAVPVLTDEADVFSEPTAKQLITPKDGGL